jgi:hypothetical protein
MARACLPERQGRARAADGLGTRASLIAFSRNCQAASTPGLQPPPFVHGAPNPLLLTPQTVRCPWSCHKNVWGRTDAFRSCTASWSCFPYNRALKAAHSPCGRGLRGPSNFLRDFWLQVWFSGAARGSRSATNADSSAKNRASCAVHVLPRSWRRIPGVCIFKVHMY